MTMWRGILERDTVALSLTGHRCRETEPYNSWGNGSAMRVSPTACARESLDEVLALAEQTALVTHNHPDGIAGAQATAGSG